MREINNIICRFEIFTPQRLRDLANKVEKIPYHGALMVPNWSICHLGYPGRYKNEVLWFEAENLLEETKKLLKQ